MCILIYISSQSCTKRRRKSEKTLSTVCCFLFHTLHSKALLLSQDSAKFHICMLWYAVLCCVGQHFWRSLFLECRYAERNILSCFCTQFVVNRKKSLRFIFNVGKGKVVRVHVMQAYGGVELQLHPFLTSAVRGGEWSDSRPCHSLQVPQNRRVEQWYSIFFVRVPPDVFSLQLCTPKFVGAWLKLYSL